MRPALELFAVTGLAAAAVAADNELSTTEKGGGWRLLFDGRTKETDHGTPRSLPQPS